ncbi:MAG TPA: hypothetical protein VLG66_13845 [Alphaproteobacteria bacterium]|nr:hypothetical protein [Alphaproteobacteria bacterium]
MRRPLTHPLLHLSIALLGAAFASPQSQAQECPQAPEAQISVQAALPSSTIAAHNDLSALKQIAALYNNRHQPLGLYVTRVQPELSVRVVTRTLPRGICMWLQSIDVTISLTERTIHVAREYLRGSCEYQAILQHELKHAQADDAILKIHVPRIEQALRNAAAERGAIGPFAPQGEADAQIQLRAGVEKAFRESLTQMMRDRVARQGSVDTPQEYRAVAASCPSGLRLDRLSQ